MTCVRENIPAIGVVFNNGQWGAEKKNQVYFMKQIHNFDFKNESKKQKWVVNGNNIISQFSGGFL